MYHTASTGYAGIYAARAAIETGSPGIVTEHGIYTNERRVEISLADWIHQAPPNSLDLGAQPRGLKDMWKETFASYSRICYESCRDILTIFEGNQAWQQVDGADPQKMRVIPNGIEIERFTQIERQADRPPTIAMIGRVVPIKDIKTFLRACRTLKARIPTLRALVVGPSDEDPDYDTSCRQFVQANGLSDTIAFTGRRKIDEVLAEVDVCVLTSISEGQPLVILEAGAAGVPFVATDVGACCELIYGRGDEKPNLGQGGLVTPVANPTATAAAIERLLTEPDFAHACGETMRKRVARYYDKNELIKTYRNLYDAKANDVADHTHRPRYIWDATGDA